MKKNIQFSILIAFLTLFSANVFAVDYGLWVASIQVTDVNKNNITGTDISGSVSYNSTTNTLTLNNASINTNSKYTIKNQIPNLTINLVGNNTIINKNDQGIYSATDFTITGTGSLTINAGSDGIVSVGSYLTIENTTVTVISDAHGICGAYGNTEVLTITNSTIRATGANTASIAKINNLVLNGCEITQPEDAVFDAGKGGVCLNGTLVTSEVVITPIPTYDLYVAGVQVNDANKDDITSAVVAAGHTASGVITYDPGSKTLTLNSATIDMTDMQVRGIQSLIDKLTINLIGDNNVTAKYHAITFEQGTNSLITGAGSLRAESTNDNYNDVALYHYKSNLTIENTTVTAIGGAYGISGWSSNSDLLTIKNSTVRAYGRNQGPICRLSNLVLNDCFISQPAGAIFDLSQKAVCLHGERVKAEVVIEPIISYNLKIANVPITSVNKDYIPATLVAAGHTASGEITYDPKNKILTLDNVSISTSANCINSSIANLTINLVGKNSLTTTTDLLVINDITTITGSGSLTANAPDCCSAIVQSDSNSATTLTIDNTTITISGGSGYNGNNTGNIVVNNSLFRATGSSTDCGSINRCNSLTLYGCKIIQPAGAIFDASQKAVCLNGEIVKTEVVIEPISGAGVRGTLSDNVKIRMQDRQLTVENSDRNPIAVYNVMGQLIATRYNPGETETIVLPAAGVYIVKVGKGATKVVAL